MTTLAPEAVRYIKLGPGGRWAKTCFAKGELHFGYGDIDHNLCLAGSWDQVTEHFISNESRTPGKAKDATREIKDFYTLGANCLWITFAEGHLWWAFAEPEVVSLGQSSQDRGARFRRVIGGWRHTDLNGTRLSSDDLSTRLTKVSGYRQTICSVEASDYLIRRINGIEDPLQVRAREAHRALTGVVADMIANLHQSDFETLVDLIFARSGWQRVSRVGGTQKDFDLILQEPISGQMAFVQVKSRADQKVLDDYIERGDAPGRYDHIFFVCHTPKGELAVGDRDDVHIWARGELADMAVKSGLYDWLMEKSA